MRAWRFIAFLSGAALAFAAPAVAPAPAMAADAIARTIFVPNKTLYPGDVIAADALTEQPLAGPRPGAATFGANADDLVGKVARRTLLRGEIIPQSAVRAPDVVVQGRTYALIYKSSVLSLSATGVPLQPGALGQIINVRNPETGVIVKARVRGDETLVVELQ